ncbi:MAG: hypothetical protein NC122_05085 [Faecalibacterium sp.]|nr:hypothetical protein [Ruminococcus sp.]MCM1391864.1 hypothetical protein [Ruminococcus sp.]MCM1485560.1 hypothetical protein [Faecalibacterium sp.]
MTLEQYWEQDPYLTIYFNEKYRLEIENRNQELWLQGLYIYKAFDVVLANCFAKKGATPQEYLKKPIRITPKTKAEKALKAENDRKRFIEAMDSWKKRWDSSTKNN